MSNNAPVTVTEQQRQFLLGKVKTFTIAAKTVDLDLEAAEKDIAKLKPLGVVGAISGVDEIDRASTILMKMQRRRSRLTAKKLALARAQFAWAELWEEGKSVLYQEESVAALKNETLRAAVISQVLKFVKRKKDKVSHLIDQVDTLLWEIKSNQAALEYQIQLYKEKSWEFKRGLQ